jgi:replicative DNA helicase
MIDTPTQQFLSALHQGGQFSYWWTAEGRQSFWWEAGAPSPLPGGSRNVYVGVHPTTQIPHTNRRGEAADPRALRAQLPIVAAINCLFAEYDAKDFSDDKGRARALVTTLVPAPSVVVDSGGGYHCYWLLDEPYVLATPEIRERARKLQAAWVVLMDGDKQSKDLARVLRVPGTRNLKYTPPRAVDFVDCALDRRYNIAELAALARPYLEQTQSQANGRTPNPVAAQTAYGAAALRGEAEKVRTIADGLKHGQLLRSAIALGGLVDAGVITESQIIETLEAAIGERAADFRNAQDTIRDGISYGKARPRYIPQPKVTPGHSANTANTANEPPHPAGASVEPWGRIVSFDDTELPDFPTEVLPGWLRDFVEAEAEATQTPRDLAGMLALSVLATCAQRWIIVEARPGWIEPTNLYTVTALPPASRKSAVFRAFVAPLLAYEQEQASDAKRKIAETETLRDILEERLNAAKREAAKATKNDAESTAMERANDLSDELSELSTPVVPRLIVDDVTPEALASLLAEQGGRMAALSPEGDVFAIMAGRYSGTSGPNFGVFLKAHAGDTLRVDRRSRSEFVDWPALTLGITTQPDVVRGLAEKAGFRGQGLLGRFLYALPASLIGRRRVDAAPVPESVRQLYHARIATLLQYRALHSANCANTANSEKNRLLDDSNSIYIYKISTEASILLDEFLAWVEPHLATDAAFGSFADWAGKLAGATLRIAALFHMASRIGSHNSHNSQNEIDAETLADALRLAQYLIAHARAAFLEMGSDPAIAGARRALAWIIHQDVREFTKRDLFEGIKGSIPKADDLDPLLKALCDHGYIRPIDMGDRGGPGRKPSQRYDVHPDLSGSSHNSRNSQNATLPSYTFDLPPHVEPIDALDVGDESGQSAAAHGLIDRLRQRGTPRVLTEAELLRDNPDTAFSSFTGTPVETEGEEHHATEREEPRNE